MTYMVIKYDARPTVRMPRVEVEKLREAMLIPCERKTITMAAVSVTKQGDER